VDGELVERARKQLDKEPIEHRPADDLEPEWDELKRRAGELDGFDGSDEDVLTFALFPGVAPKFLAERKEGPRNLSRSPDAPVQGDGAGSGAGGAAVDAPVTYDVRIGDSVRRVTVEPA
jgi:methylmalonyl-CoA carboxyltransferase 5S subunit